MEISKVTAVFWEERRAHGHNSFGESTRITEWAVEGTRSLHVSDWEEILPLLWQMVWTKACQITDKTFFRPGCGSGALTPKSPAEEDVGLRRKMNASRCLAFQCPSSPGPWSKGPWAGGTVPSRNLKVKERRWPSQNYTRTASYRQSNQRWTVFLERSRLRKTKGSGAWVYGTNLTEVTLVDRHMWRMEERVASWGIWWQHGLAVSPEEGWVTWKLDLHCAAQLGRLALWPDASVRIFQPHVISIQVI